MTQEAHTHTGGIGTAALTALVYATWACVFAWLLDAGRYTAFLQPSLWPLLVGGLLLCVALGSAALRQRDLTAAHAADSTQRWLSALILLVPLAYLVPASNADLGSYAFGKRDLGGSIVPQASSLQTPTTPPDFDGSEPVSLLDLVYSAASLEGKTVHTEGKVFLTEDVREGHFQLYRFVVVCCAADAQPVSVLVKTADLDKVKDDTWVQTRGTLRNVNQDGQDLVIVDATRLRTIDMPPPRDQFLFQPLW